MFPNSFCWPKMSCCRQQVLTVWLRCWFTRPADMLLLLSVQMSQVRKCSSILLFISQDQSTPWVFVVGIGLAPWSHWWQECSGHFIPVEMANVGLGVEKESIFSAEIIEAAVNSQNGVSTARIWTSPWGQGPSCRVLDTSLNRLWFHLGSLNTVKFAQDLV